jgi:hypothetical protein
MDRCFDPLNQPAWYLGVLRSTCDGMTLRLHAYLTQGEDVVSYSAVGPRDNPEDAHVLLTKAEQESATTEAELVALAIAGDARGALPGWTYNRVCSSWDKGGSSIFRDGDGWLLCRDPGAWSVTDPRAGMREDELS